MPTTVRSHVALLPLLLAVSCPWEPWRAARLVHAAAAAEAPRAYGSCAPRTTVALRGGVCMPFASDGDVMKHTARQPPHSRVACP